MLATRCLCFSPVLKNAVSTHRVLPLSSALLKPAGYTVACRTIRTVRPILPAQFKANTLRSAFLIPRYFSTQSNNDSQKQAEKQPQKDEQEQNEQPTNEQEKQQEEDSDAKDKDTQQEEESKEDSDKAKEDTEEGETKEEKAGEEGTKQEEGETAEEFRPPPAPEWSWKNTVPFLAVTLAIWSAIYYFTDLWEYVDPLHPFQSLRLLYNALKDFLKIRYKEAEEFIVWMRKDEPFLPTLTDHQKKGRQYTLVVDFDALVAATMHKGQWEVQQRGGVDYFVAHVALPFEVLLYTKDGPTNFPVLFRVDPTGGLYFHHIRMADSNMKELGAFRNVPELYNRDLSRLIILDSRPIEDIPAFDNVINIGSAIDRPNDAFLSDLAWVLSAATHLRKDAREIVKELRGPNLIQNIATAKANFESQLGGTKSSSKRRR